ncbi:aspartate aminotransferase family protein [Thermohalobacter berrensis]|uniref:Acetylornithine aminotransferase n=1 Tax=Thermohalobacter berrensis TaxID=99594 RepID=A0A419T555_9FIRM|nr:aspartate aminotransferase family protein [Thermohalobacter berrensis]RKD32559.1 acetylornithine aminotransferase [Thermohalobacter berrensis]
MGKNYIMNTYNRFNVTFEKGIGSKLYDINGKEYIDFVSGIAVNCLGHSHPSIVKAIAEQSKKLMNVSNLYWTREQNKLAEMLIKISNHNKIFFCNSGTESVETALKIARKYGKKRGGNAKKEIIYMTNSFHGRTLGALTVTGQEKYKKDFTPLMEGIKSAQFNNIKDLKDKIGENTCGVIIEPIQGEGGIHVANKNFLKEARKLCDMYDALLIFDEVQCGVGRTGKFFAYQNYEIVPDVVCMAKGLGGGFPIGAVLAVEKAANVLVPGDHGCTFGGNSLACRVSMVILKELIDGGVIKKVKDKSEYIINKLKYLSKKYEYINEIRGKGLMLGVSITCDAKKFIQKCFKNGLLLVSAGKNTVRILPPLNINKGDIDIAVDIIDKTFKEISTKN